MSNYDLRPAVDIKPGDGQLYHSEGVTPDEFYNCVWEGVRIAARDLGGDSRFDAEQLRHLADSLTGRSPNHYGERFETAALVIAKTYPTLKAWTEYPADIVGALTGHIAAGRLVEIGFYCDSAANVPAQGPVTYSHNELQLANDTDAGVVTFGNVEPHPTYQLTYDQVRSLYDSGGILVIESAAPGEDEMPLNTQAEVISGYMECLGRPPESFDVINANKAEIAADGSNLDVWLAGLVWSSEAQRWRATLQTLANNAPALLAAVGKEAELEKALVAAQAEADAALKAAQSAQEQAAAAQAAAAAAAPKVVTDTPAPASSVDPSWPALLAELLRRVLGRS